MKVKVNRLLKSGRYHVSFELTDFTPEEVAKMSSFGIPSIPMRWVTSSGQVSGAVSINQISKAQTAVFDDEKAARDYEGQFLIRLRAEMERLRKSEDDFSSSQEVEL